MRETFEKVSLKLLSKPFGLGDWVESVQLDNLVSHPAVAR
jgi:hypothetical protein